MKTTKAIKQEGDAAKTGNCPMKKIGRKTKLNQQLQRRVCALLSQGHTIATVSAMVSIGERTFYEWCEKHPQFSQATTCAIGKSKIALVNKLRRSDDWRASAFLLERRFPAEFGRVEVREIPLTENQKQIDVAFILNMPDGTQRQTSWEEAREMVAIAGKQKAPALASEHEENAAPLDGNHATEPNGEQPLS
jgi:hypothetical protein